MNYVACIGLLSGVSVVMFGIMLGSPLPIFFDVPSLIIGPGAAMMLLVATFGLGTVCSAFKSGFRSLFVASGSPQDPEQARVVKMVATSGINYSMLTGFIGGLIGLIQMLQNMSDPTAIGPAMAVSLLSAFYAGVMVMFVYYPMARNAEHQFA